MDMFANIDTAFHPTSDYLPRIERSEFNFPKAERLLTGNASTMSASSRILLRCFEMRNRWHSNFQTIHAKKEKKLSSTPQYIHALMRVHCVGAH